MPHDRVPIALEHNSAYLSAQDSGGHVSLTITQDGDAKQIVLSPGDARQLAEWLADPAPIVDVRIVINSVDPHQVVFGTTPPARGREPRSVTLEFSAEGDSNPFDVAGTDPRYHLRIEQP